MNQLDKYFIYKCEKGLVERGLSDRPEYVERLKFELDTITRMGFSGYFLIVSDFINWAKRNNIYVGPGRGSAAGCLASYCLRVTNLDPIRWKLLFERFLNPDRISMPDIDVDFENRRRDQVIDYVAQRYGEDHVAHIGTFGTMKAKSAVKDVCRVLGEPILMGEKLSKLLLAPVHGKPQPLKTSFEKVAELSKAYNSDTREGTVLRWAEKIENLKKSMGVHACLAGNTKILTKNGLQKIEDIFHCELKTNNRWQPAVCFSSGKKDVFRLHVARSKFSSKTNHIDLTTDHKVFTKEHGWISAGDCIGSIAVCCPPQLNAWKLVTLAGWFWNDGYTNEYGSKIYFTEGKDKEAVEYFGNLLLSQDKRRKDRFGVSFEVIKQIKHLFGEGCIEPTHSKVPPKIPVEKFPQGLKLAWLRGIMSANASVQRGTVRLKLTSKAMIDYIKALLATLDLETTEPSRCKGKAIMFPNGEYQCRDSWQIEMSVNPSWRFKNLIGFIQTYKNEAIPDQYYQKLEYLGEQEVYDFTVDTDDDTERNTYANGILVHNCGIVIGNESIHDKIPLFKGRGGEITTQLEMNNIEDLGFIKFDFLGVEALDKMHACVDIVKERHNVDIDMENIPLDDELVFSNLRAGDAVGIFQLEASAGMKDLLVQIRPTSVEDLIALVAIYRPGPLGSTYKDTYLNVRAGNQEPDYLVPELAPILERTGGWLIYQEQIMEIAKTLANYTGGEADELRKAVGKKKEKLMNKHEPKFKAGWVKHGLPAAAADQLWDDMVSFAAYGFNRTVDKNTLVDTLEGPKRIEDCSSSDVVFTVQADGKVVTTKVVALHDHGTVPLWEVEFDDGTVEKCTLDHKWLTEWGQQPLWQILEMDCEVWGADRNDQITGRTQEDMQTVSQSSSFRHLRQDEKDYAMWHESEVFKRRRQKAQAKLRRLQKKTQGNQAPDESKEQQDSRSSQDSVRDSKKDRIKTRNMRVSGSSLGPLAIRKPRKTLQELEEGLCQSQEIKDGDLVRTSPTQTWIQTERTDTLRGRPQTGGFYQQREAGNPRGGWTVALYSGSWRRSTTENPEQGSDVRHRDLAKRVAASPHLYGELQNLRRTYETKRRGPVKYLDKWGLPCDSVCRKVIRISYLGMRQGYDLEVDHPDHNFLLASGLCCSNSHAAAYAFITYQTAYLKAHYPTEFLCAVMLCVGKKKKDHLIKCLTECRRLGIKVLPPDINESRDSFSVTENKEIRFGIGPIKNVGAGSDVILEERRLGGPFKNIRDFCERINLGVINRGKLEALIRAGAFDRFGQNRATMLGAVEAIWQYRDKMKKYEKKVQTYLRKEEKRLEREKEIEEGSKKKPMKPWPKPEEPQWPEIVEMDELKDSEIHNMEHELLGFFVSSHPLDNINLSTLSDSFNTIDDMQDMGNDQPVVFAGIITNVKEITTKTKKQKMAFVLIEDLTGSIEATIFSKVYARISHLLEKKKPILVEGSLDITQADEGDKTVKVRVKNITLLNLNITSNQPEWIDVCVPSERANNLLKLLDKHAGDLHEVRVMTSLQDGTKIRYPIRSYIGNTKSVFMREIARLKDGTMQ